MKGILALLFLVGIAAAYWYLPAQARRRYSETGVFYTVDYVTLHLPGGVVGFPPGSRLLARFDIHVPDKELVTDGTHLFALDPKSLTHDMDYAQELAEADQEGQDRASADLDQMKSRVAANRREAEIITAEDIDRMNASLVSASIVGNDGASLWQPASAAGVYGGYSGFGGAAYSPTQSSTAAVAISSSARGGTSTTSQTSTTASSPQKISLNKPQPLARPGIAGPDGSFPTAAGPGRGAQ